MLFWFWVHWSLPGSCHANFPLCLQKGLWKMWKVGKKCPFPGDPYGKASRKDNLDSIQFHESREEPCCRKHWEGSNVPPTQKDRPGIRQLGLRWVERVPPPTFDCCGIKHKLLHVKHNLFTIKSQHTFPASSAPSLLVLGLCFGSTLLPHHLTWNVTCFLTSPLSRPNISSSVMPLHTPSDKYLLPCMHRPLVLSVHSASPHL